MYDACWFLHLTVILFRFSVSIAAVSAIVLSLISTHRTPPCPDNKLIMYSGLNDHVVQHYLEQTEGIYCFLEALILNKDSFNVTKSLCIQRYERILWSLHFLHSSMCIDLNCENFIKIQNIIFDWDVNIHMVAGRRKKVFTLVSFHLMKMYNVSDNHIKTYYDMHVENILYT